MPLKLIMIVLAVLSQGASAQDIPTVSMVQLLSTPDKFDGRVIRVTGYLHCEFEDSAIYLSKADGDHLIGENAFWVNYSSQATLHKVGSSKPVPVKSSRNCGANRKYASIQGRFNSRGRGHLASCAGAIDDVMQIVELRRYGP